MLAALKHWVKALSSPVVRTEGPGRPVRSEGLPTPRPHPLSPLVFPSIALGCPPQLSSGLKIFLLFKKMIMACVRDISEEESKSERPSWSHCHAVVEGSEKRRTFLIVLRLALAPLPDSRPGHLSKNTAHLPPSKNKPEISRKIKM